MSTARIIKPRLLCSAGQRCASEQSLSPIDVFTARAEARALLFTVSEFDVIAAVDALQAAAVASGLVASIGQDAVQDMTTPVHSPRHVGSQMKNWRKSGYRNSRMKLSPSVLPTFMPTICGMSPAHQLRSGPLSTSSGKDNDSREFRLWRD
jgi:hypothetical protein